MSDKYLAEDKNKEVIFNTDGSANIEYSCWCDSSLNITKEELRSLYEHLHEYYNKNTKEAHGEINTKNS